MTEQPGRILIVEDSGTQALKLRLVLEEAGWNITCSSTADGALAEINQNLPDLMIVDYHLPGMKGDELCRQVRMNFHTRSIPILMLTVEDTDIAQMRGLESGADDYLSKSVAPEILVLRTRALLRKSTAASSILAPENGYFRSARILLIDDSPTYVAFLTEELKTEGYELYQALSGKAGLDLFASMPLDCVLVDLVMPDLNGVEVCKRITELRRSMENPATILMVTSQESEEQMTRGLAAGADDFVGKSTDIVVLKARIRALLRRKFFQEENYRIAQELNRKELEAVRARAEKEAAEVRAALAEEITETNRELAQANQKLRAAQAHLVHAEKMASLGQLVAGIAHEINNPLAFSLSNLFTIEEQIKRLLQALNGSIDAKSVARLEKISARAGDMRQGLDRVKDLVLNLRTFSRLDEGEFKTVDIVESIESTLLLLRHKLKERIVIDKDYGCERKISCHPGELNQVLMNLLSNAVDAIHDEGTITIRTQNQDGMFTICIRDTGKGIPDKLLPRIFEPFFTTKAVGEGTGLGLSIAYGIVKSHQGTIDVASKEGEGTEFLVRIPLDLKGMKSS